MITSTADVAAVLILIIYKHTLYNAGIKLSFGGKKANLNKFIQHN
jgi:hypothetical protein